MILYIQNWLPISGSCPWMTTYFICNCNRQGPCLFYTAKAREIQYSLKITRLVYRGSIRRPLKEVKAKCQTVIRYSPYISLKFFDLWHYLATQVNIKQSNRPIVIFAETQILTSKIMVKSSTAFQLLIAWHVLGTNAIHT